MLNKTVRLSLFSVLLFALGCSTYNSENENIVPLIVGHGGSGFETFFHRLPANTIQAFDKAIYEDAADGIEMDIQLSIDDVVVVFHDRILENKTDCSGKVRETTFADLKTCDFYGDFSMGNKNENNISSLDEVFAHFKDMLHEKVFYLNIKMGVDDNKDLYIKTLSTKLVELISKYHIQNNVIVEAPDFNMILAVRNLDNAIPIMCDIGLFEKDYGRVVENHLAGLVVAKNNITKEQVKQAQNDGFTVVIYGVKTRLGIIEVLNMQPDVIQTDRVSLTKKLRD